ncbi:phospholipid scramblase family member 5-like [Aquarana catesbeiana]|uniref:phospholipid scramblase family member 5-like n=1 Tax=Aquarana catesbeiana TaxID=8400 RepID=UPI003CC9B7DF
MSVIHSQPSPFGYLQREKHIEHHTKKPKEEKTCKCMEAQHRQRSLQQDGGLRRTEKNVEQPYKKLANPKKVEISRRGSNRVSCPPSQSAATSHKITTDREMAMQRTLSVVEELNESVCSELQILAGAQQFCITSNAKPKGFCCQSERLYIISSRTAKQLLVAIEDSSSLCLQLCGPARSCYLRLCDQNRQEVLKFSRPYREDVCCLFCCLMVIRVFNSSNSLLGFVQQRWSLFSPSLSVHNSEGIRTMDICGSWSAARCHTEQEFQVTSLEGQIVAIIWKRWPGFNEDYNMDHDFFGLDISASLSPTDKALLLAATFLLNYMFFEMS